MDALIYCDGGVKAGYGHVRRCLLLARVLHTRHQMRIVFALNGDESAAAVLREAGFETLLLAPDGQAHALATYLAARSPDLMVIDARQILSRADVAALAEHVWPLAIIDDIGERRLAASHAYFTPLPQVKALSWEGAHTAVRVGWQWALLGFEPGAITRGASSSNAPARIVISMGGSDPADFSRIALAALTRMTPPFRARFVIGPGFRDGDALARDVTARGFEAVQGSSDLKEEFAAADCAVIAFGVTAYEMAALGVPALYLALTEDHALAAAAFAEAGMGEIVPPDAPSIAAALTRLLADNTRRASMAARARSLIDGKGAERIADELAALCED